MIWVIGDIHGMFDPLKMLLSIDLDTGAVYGGRLTAMGFSEESLEEGKFLVAQVATSRGYRFFREYSVYCVYPD